MKKLNYLLVTHIPFARNEDGDAVVDALWARDLLGLSESIGTVRVVGPQVEAATLQSWGPGTVAVPRNCGVEFVGFPAIRSRLDLWKWPSIRAVLRREVKRADLVHSSNPFAPYLGLVYAHDYATRMGKKTLVVVAEDFVDMLRWEWERAGANRRQRLSRQKTIDRLEATVQDMVATASLSFLHTPAAVERFRLSAKNGVSIRQPMHEPEDIVSAADLEQRFMELESGRPLRVAAACRHSALKGLDMLINAVGLLQDRGVCVELTLFGQGGQTSQLQDLIQRRGVGDSITIAGSVPPGHRLYQALSGFDLFAMTHRTTDFGRAFWDAMACGLPVIAFRTPAANGTVNDSLDGFLTPLDDPQSLSEKLGQLHENRQLLIDAARGARRRALDNTRAQWYRIRAQWIRDLFPAQNENRAGNLPQPRSTHAASPAMLTNR